MGFFDTLTGMPPLGEAVNCCARLAGVTGLELEEEFRKRAPPGLQHGDGARRNLLEFAVFRAFAALGPIGIRAKIKDAAFRRLSFGLMQAWQAALPAATERAILYSVVTRTAPQDAFLRLAPALLPSGALGRVTVAALFDTLSRGRSELPFEIWDRYLLALDSLYKAHATETDSEAQALKLAPGEYVLSRGGASLARDTAETGVHGHLVLTNHALYFQADWLITRPAPLRLDLVLGLDQHLQKEKSGPLGTQIFDRAIAMTSKELDKPWVIDFVEYTSHQLRDCWMAEITEVLSVHAFVREHWKGGRTSTTSDADIDEAGSSIGAAHLSGDYWDDDGVKEAVALAAAGVTSLQAAMAVLGRLPSEPDRLLPYTWASRVPQGNLVELALAVAIWGSEGAMEAVVAQLEASLDDVAVLAEQVATGTTAGRLDEATGKGREDRRDKAEREQRHLKDWDGLLAGDGLEAELDDALGTASQAEGSAATAATSKESAAMNGQAPVKAADGATAAGGTGWLRSALQPFLTTTDAAAADKEAALASKDSAALAAAGLEAQPPTPPPRPTEAIAPIAVGQEVATSDTGLRQPLKGTAAESAVAVAEAGEAVRQAAYGALAEEKEGHVKPVAALPDKAPQGMQRLYFWQRNAPKKAGGPAAAAGNSDDGGSGLTSAVNRIVHNPMALFRGGRDDDVEYLVVAKELEVGRKTKLEHAVELCRAQEALAAQAQSSIDQALISGIPTNVQLLGDLLSPIIKTGKEFIGLTQWERPLASVVCLFALLACIHSDLIFWNLIPILLLGIVFLMIILRFHKHLSRNAPLKMTTGPPSSAVSQLIMLKEALDTVEHILQGINVALLKWRTLVHSDVPPATNKVIIVFTAVALFLLLVPIRVLMSACLVFLFTANLFASKQRASGQPRLQRASRLSMWWNSIPVAPVRVKVVDPAEEEAKEKREEAELGKEGERYGGGSGSTYTGSSTTRLAIDKAKRHMERGAQEFADEKKVEEQN